MRILQCIRDFSKTSIIIPLHIYHDTYIFSNDKKRVEAKISFFVQCTKMQLITLQKTIKLILANFYGFSP